MSVPNEELYKRPLIDASVKYQFIHQSRFNGEDFFPISAIKKKETPIMQPCWLSYCDEMSKFNKGPLTPSLKYQFIWPRAFR